VTFARRNFFISFPALRRAIAIQPHPLYPIFHIQHPQFSSQALFLNCQYGSFDAGPRAAAPATRKRKRDTPIRTRTLHSQYLQHHQLLLLLPYLSACKRCIPGALQHLSPRIPRHICSHSSRNSLHVRFRRGGSPRSYWLCGTYSELAEPMGSDRVLDADCVLDNCPCVHGWGYLSLSPQSRLRFWAGEFKNQS
jgi:hypothetical protein